MHSHASVINYIIISFSFVIITTHSRTYFGTPTWVELNRGLLSCKGGVGGDSQNSGRVLIIYYLRLKFLINLKILIH